MDLRLLFIRSTSAVCVWRASLAGCPAPTPLLSHPPPQQKRERNDGEKLLGQNKDRDRMYPFPSWAKQAQLGEVKLFPMKIDLCGEVEDRLKH